jgi:NADPH:quinone reductase-like Zn-dependent oxidoreductase
MEQQHSMAGDSKRSMALVTTAHGGAEVMKLLARAVPEPGPGQVRVAMKAAAFNHLDLWVRRGIPANHWPIPLVPCADGAGVIDAVGPGVDTTGAPHLQLGGEVALFPVVTAPLEVAALRGVPHVGRTFGMLGETVDGCAREHLVINAANVMPKPANISWPQAAALPTTFITAYHMLKARARLQAGETVLIHGARSGVGSAGVQLARVLGAKVIATVRRDADEAIARALGADEVVRSDDRDWPKQVKALSGGGVEVVFEHIGAATWDGSIRVLQRGGRLVTCGATAGHEVKLNLRKLFFHNIALLGSTMGTRADFLDVLRLAELDKIAPHVGHIAALSDGASALSLLEDRSVFGKVVLDLTAQRG